MGWRLALAFLFLTIMLAAVLTMAYSVTPSVRNLPDVSGNVNALANVRKEIDTKWYDMSGNNFLPGLSHYSNLGLF